MTKTVFAQFNSTPFTTPYVRHFDAKVDCEACGHSLPRSMILASDNPKHLLIFRALHFRSSGCHQLINYVGVN